MQSLIIRIDAMQRKYLILISSLALVAGATTYIYHRFEQPEILYAKGNRLFEARLHERAAPYFKKALELRPNYLPALRELGLAALWTKEYDTARRCFEKLLAMNQKDLFARRGLIDIKSFSGDRDAAIPEYRRLLEEHPEDVKTMLSLAYALYWNKDYEDAIPLFKKYLTTEPTHQESIAYLADSMAQTGREDEGRELIASLEKNFRGYSPALKAIAGYYLNRNEFDKAVEYYNRAKSARPDDIEAVERLIDCYTAMKQTDMALATVEDALKRDPDDATLLISEANLHLYSKNFAGAEKKFSSILERWPDDPGAAIGMARVYAWQGMMREALPYFIKAGGRISDPSLLREMAAAYLGAGRAGEAVELYNKMMTSGSFTEEDLRSAAEASIAAKNLPAAEKLLRDALANNPADASARQRLGDVLSWQGRFQEAEAQYKVLLKKRKAGK